MALWLLPGFGFVGVVFATLLFLASRYKRCSSDQILVVFGRVGEGQSARCVHGGGLLVWPLIQDYAYLSLTPLTIGIPLQNALSLQNIRINVPSTFTVGISTDPATMNNAAERLLNLQRAAIEDLTKEIIFGQLRLTVASLTIEQINQDRERFLEAIRKNVEPELNKIGLYLINVNVTDITDESNYIDSIGKKAASEALNQARVDVAEEEKKGAIGAAEAQREQEIKVAENRAAADKGTKAAEADRRVFVQQQEAAAISGENASKATIAEVDAELRIKQADAQKRGEVAQLDALAEIQRAQYRAEQERLRADVVVKEEINKQQVEIAAEAEAEKARREARGFADATLARYEAEAKGVKQLLASKADGYRALVASCGGDARAAATFLLVEKLEDIVARQVEAIKNIKIDKITVWDSGQGNGAGAGASTSTANFVSGLIKAVPPLQEVAAMAGVELPDYLGKMVDDSSGAKPRSPEA